MGRLNMNKNIKMLVKVLMVFFMMITAIVPASAETFASLKPINKDEMAKEEKIWVNPMYAGEISEDQLRDMLIKQKAEKQASEEPQIMDFSSVEEAGEYMRYMMINKITEIEIHVDGSAFPLQEGESGLDAAERLFDTLFLVAIEETENSYEGDYILFNTLGYYLSRWYDGDQYGFNLEWSFLTTPEQEETVTAEVARLLDELDLFGYSEEYRAAKLYDYICATVTYDYDNLNDDSYTLKHSTYAAIIDHCAVCQGYASMYYRLGRELGLHTRGITGGNHAWNIVGFEGEYDGIDQIWYYNIDSTWDAGTSPKNYSWYLKSMADFPQHLRETYFALDYTSDEFNAKYPMAPLSSSYPSEPEVKVTSFTAVSDDVVKCFDELIITTQITPASAGNKHVSIKVVEGDGYASRADNGDGTFTLVFDTVGDRVILVECCGYKVYLPVKVVENIDIDEFSVPCGDDLTASFDLKYRQLFITGSGAMNDYQDGEQPWASAIPYINGICIDEGVTSIGNNAFVSFPKLTYIYYAGGREAWNNVVIGSGNDAIRPEIMVFPVVITADPEDKEAAAGGSAYYSVTAEGYNLSYQWEYSTDKCDWCPLSGETGAELFLYVTEDMPVFYMVRCVVTDFFGNEKISAPAKLTIVEPKVYAVLTEYGELVFDWSVEDYVSGTRGVFRNARDEEYEGIIYGNITSVPWKNEKLSIYEFYCNDPDRRIELTNMDGWFDGCSNLEIADMEGFVVTGSMNNTFRGCNRMYAFHMVHELAVFPVIHGGLWRRYDEQGRDTGYRWNNERMREYYDPAYDWAWIPCCGWWIAEEFYEAAEITSVTYSKAVNTIKWNKVSGAKSYEVWCSYAGGAYKKLATVKNSASSYKHKKIKTGKEYRYVIKTVFSDDKMDSAVRPFIYMAKPTIKVASYDYDQVKITISKTSSGATRYHLYRKDSKSATVLTDMGTFTGTTYIAGPVETGKTYYYVVKAEHVFSDLGTTFQSGASSAVSGKSALKKPAISSAVQTQYNAVTVSYGEINGAEKYQILRSTSAKKGYKVIGTSDTLSYIDETVIPGKTYYYQVKAVRNVNGKDVLSAASSYKKIKVSIPAIKALATVINEDGTVTVSWSENKYTVSYQLYYSTNKKKSYKSAGMFETLEGITPVLTKGKTYYFKVRCVVTINGKNYYSGYSNIISKKLPK